MLHERQLLEGASLARAACISRPSPLARLRAVIALAWRDNCRRQHQRAISRTLHALDDKVLDDLGVVRQEINAVVDAYPFLSVEDWR